MKANRPLVILAVCFAAGLALGDYAQRFPQTTMAVLLTAAIAIIVASRIQRERILFLFPAIAIACGIIWWNVHNQPEADDVGRLVDHPRVKDHFVQLRGTVVSDVKETETGKQFYLAAEEIVAGNWRRQTEGFVAAYAPPTLQTEPGDEVQLIANLKEPGEAGNPGQISRKHLLQRDGIYCGAEVSKDEPPFIAPGKRSGLALWAIGLRQRMLDRTRETMPGPYAEIASRLLFSIVYGMQATPLPDSIVDSFRTAGVMHVLVVSGSQVAFFFLFMHFIAARARGRRWLLAATLAGTILALGFYYLLCSAPPTRIPSLARATIMALLMSIGLLFARDVDVLTSLAAAALALLIANPLHLYSIGFQLSFTAVLGILLAAGTFLGRQKGPTALSSSRRMIGALLAASLGAQLMTLPLLAHYFGRISLIGVIANLIAVPIAAALIPLGLLGSLCAVLFEPLAAVLNFTNYHLTLLLLGLTDFFSAIPMASLEVSRWSSGDVAFFYAFLALAGFAMITARAQQPRWDRVLVTAAFLTVAFSGYQFAQTRPLPLEITVLDVGDGDSIFLRSPSGKTMLVDAGTRANPLLPISADAGQRVVIPFLLTQKVSYLDCVVATHPHDDHISGLPTVLRRMPAGLILDAGERLHTPYYDALRYLAQQRGIQHRIARPGQVINLGGGVRAHVLTPLHPRFQQTHSDLNNNSIALKVVYGKFSMVLGADLEEEAEQRLVQIGEDLRCTALKAPHHGSKTSNTETFLRAVAPEVTIVSCGASPFLHPAPETLDRLRAAKTQIYRTDIHGAVTIRSDGTSYQISTFKDGVVSNWKRIAQVKHG